MIKIACYIHNEWAFGNIHHELVKYIHPYGIDSLVLCWDKKYTNKEFTEYDQTVDLYLTTPQGTYWLLNSQKSVPEKCITVFHSQLDLLFVKNHFSPELIERCNGFAAVSKYLITRAKELGLDFPITHLPLGVNYNRYFYKPTDSIKTIGYAGHYISRIDHNNGVSDDNPGLYKRSFLAKEIAEELNLNFKIAQSYHNSFVTMPGYYPTVDVIICPSMNEGAGLPILEAGAAGKIILTTTVGHFPEKITIKGAIPIPYEESIFKNVCKKIISYYVKNPKAYKQKCEEVQEHAKSYDWKYCIEDWAQFIISKST